MSQTNDVGNTVDKSLPQQHWNNARMQAWSELPVATHNLQYLLIPVKWHDTKKLRVSSFHSTSRRLQRPYVNSTIEFYWCFLENNKSYMTSRLKCILSRLHKPDLKLQQISKDTFNLTCNPSKSSIFVMAKNNGLLNITIIPRYVYGTPLAISPPFLVMLSTPPPCVHNVLWLLTTFDTSWQLHRITGSDTQHRCVALERGVLIM